MPATEPRPDAFVFIATAWGFKRGGIDTFGTELVTQLAREVDIPVICFACDLTASSVQAPGRVVLLPIPADGSTDLDPSLAPNLIAALKKECPGVARPCWIGNDSITGHLALACNVLFHGISIVIQHMDYASYHVLKDLEGAGALNKAAEQTRLISAASIACGVGPKLAALARSRLEANAETQVLELIPGLPDIVPARPPSTFSGITFGRFTSRMEPIKQAQLAIAAFARAIANAPYEIGPDPKLTVLGLENDKKQLAMLNTLAYRYAKRQVVINGAPFLEDREELLDLLRRQSVAMMLSFHEGFGLVGWEAIAAGVPLVLSKNSGLFEMLDSRALENRVHGIDVLGGKKRNEVNALDVDAVAEKIVYIARNRSKTRERAESLRRELRDRFTWKRTAAQIANAVGISLTSPQRHLLLACGNPSKDVCGFADPLNGEPSPKQWEARRLWSIAASKVASYIDGLERHGVHVLYSGVDGGNFAGAVVRNLADTGRWDSGIVTVTHSDFATDDEARDYYNTKFPGYFSDNNVDPTKPYLYLPGVVSRVAGINYRREILASRADAVLCVSGYTSVDHMIGLGIARGLPIVALSCFGGRTKERSHEIVEHNRGLGLPHALASALETAANAPLKEAELVPAIEGALGLLHDYWKRKHLPAL